jgi:hypothetical protein
VRQEAGRTLDAMLHYAYALELNKGTTTSIPQKIYNYMLRATCLTMFLVHSIQIYGFKLIYYKNIFRN